MSVRIIHLQVPGFYAEAERSRNPELRERPVIVGGNPRKRGSVQACSLDALQLGVVVGMPMLEALERVPRAKACRTDMPYYRSLSNELAHCLRDFGLVFEKCGLDAFYIHPEDAAPLGDRWIQALQKRVRERLVLPLRAGIARRKFLSRIAAQLAEREGLIEVLAGEERSFLEPLSLDVLPLVGPKTVGRLRDSGIQRVGAAGCHAPGHGGTHFGESWPGGLGVCAGAVMSRWCAPCSIPKVSVVSVPCVLQRVTLRLCRIFTGPCWRSYCRILAEIA